MIRGFFPFLRRAHTVQILFLSFTSVDVDVVIVTDMYKFSFNITGVGRVESDLFNTEISTFIIYKSE